MVVDDDVNTQLGYLVEMERYVGGRFSVSTDEADKGDRLIHVRSDRRLYMANTNFCHKT